MEDKTRKPRTRKPQTVTERKARVAKMEIDRKPVSTPPTNLYEQIEQLSAPWLEPATFDAIMQKLQPHDKMQVLMNMLKIRASQPGGKDEPKKKTISDSELKKRVFGDMKTFTTKGNVIHYAKQAN